MAKALTTSLHLPPSLPGKLGASGLVFFGSAAGVGVFTSFLRKRVLLPNHLLSGPFPLWGTSSSKPTLEWGDGGYCLVAISPSTGLSTTSRVVFWGDVEEAMDR